MAEGMPLLMLMIIYGMHAEGDLQMYVISVRAQCRALLSKQALKVSYSASLLGQTTASLMGLNP